MKELRIKTTWYAYNTIEVPDDYEVGDTLDDEWANQVDASNAELVDWNLIR